MRISGKMPEFLSPMLATLIDKPFDDPAWLFEIKWDGYRALAFVKKSQANLKSRYNNLLNGRYPSIVKDLKKIKEDAIIDGELVILDDKGVSHFQLMQNYQKTGMGTLVYYVFDLLFLNGEDLRKLPLIVRKTKLKKLLNASSFEHVRLSEYQEEKGVAFFNAAKKLKLEGIIGKRIESSYESRRSREWVKIKVKMRQEFVIGGFTAPRGSRKKFGALLVGTYNRKKELIYAGHVGGGFDSLSLKEVYNQLTPLIQKQSPFSSIVKPNAAVTWVKPQLVCEVSFSEWTEDNIMRQPIFVGLRQDKQSNEVKMEKKQPLTLKKKEKKSEITNLEKVFWPKEKYTKGDLIEYYESIAPYILPYLKNRPVMLHRFPEGITGEGFYQKNIDPHHPSWIKTCRIEHTDKPLDYLIINNLRSLLYAINLGTIDIHPLLSSIKHLEKPDFCVIDLDPHGVDFSKLIETAQVLHEILETAHIPHFCKTSGKHGLHICIPLHGKYTFEQSRQFAEIIGSLVHEKLPKITSLERNPKKRPKKVYIDCLQNRFGQSIACPYTVRPFPFAPVSTPLSWDEVNGYLDIDSFNIKTVPERLKKKGDLFKPVLGKGVNLVTALKSL